MGRFLYVWIKRVECCSYYLLHSGHVPCLYCSLSQDDWWQLREPEEEARFVKDVYTDGTAIGAWMTQSMKLRKGNFDMFRCHLSSYAGSWCTVQLNTACQDPNAMLKAAGLYIEKAKPVALPFTSTNEIVPPPGFFDKGYCKSDVDRLYIYCHSRRLRSRRTLACNVVFW